MYSTFQFVVGCGLTSLITAALVETLHFVKDRKKEKASK